MLEKWIKVKINDKLKSLFEFITPKKAIDFTYIILD